MKKILIVLLMVLTVGCAKKLPPPAGTTPGETKESVTPDSRAAKETVKESIEQREAKLHEEAKLREEAKRREEATEAARSVLKDVLFDYDKYDIREDARPTLDTIAAYMKKNEALSLVVEGHCDERGTNEYNLALGERRAKAVRDYLSSLGVPSSRMSTVTYGEEKPICTEQDETCRQKNRRAHFTVQ
ncbi:MAG: peptidoglycan-associated lipoprotein Pal [Nitrospirae bacterium]|nr:peptidoglycan-associated lipoprotein Pal [Nitrospirota bacterium]